MRRPEVIGDLFALVNILIICSIMEQRRKIEKTERRNWGIVATGLLLSVMLRFAGNHVDVHVMYVYLSIALIALFLGKVIWKYPWNYSFIATCFFLLIISVGQVLACTVEYVRTQEMLFQLPEENQLRMMVIAELIIVSGMIGGRKIINKIPLKIMTLNFVTIIIPNIITIITMALVADKIYYNSRMFANTESIVTLVIAGIALGASSICNIIVLEYYLNAKYLENEKKLQINEIALQYDYYKKLEKDMEKMRSFAHDMRNHLEALKGYRDESYHNKEQKEEYIESIAEQLNLYESYYDTGNTFIDSILHRKKMEINELGIEFKVLVDLSSFDGIRNEDLCVIFSNAIDNSVRECKSRKEESESDNMILIKAKRYRGFLSIVFENSIRKSQEEIIKKTEELETTKPDKWNHGFGLKNIKDVVQKYKGEMSIYIKDGMFCLSIIIPQ